MFLIIDGTSGGKNRVDQTNELQCKVFIYKGYCKDDFSSNILLNNLNTKALKNAMFESLASVMEFSNNKRRILVQKVALNGSK